MSYDYYGEEDLLKTWAWRPFAVLTFPEPMLEASILARTILDSGVASCYAALNRKETNMTTTYHAWTRMPGGAVEHTTLREDEWLTVEIEQADVDAAIEEWGWCGTNGALSGDPIVLQAGTDDTLCADALSYLNQGR